VLIAVGAHRSRDLSIPGVDLDGVHKGIDFLLNVNLGYKFTIGKKVIVIGGGNVAMDVARSAAREVLKQHAGGVEDAEPSAENVSAVATKEMVDISLSALRMGAREVDLVCLERREEMPAALEEIVEAEEEGIIMYPGLGPKRIVGRDGKVAALETLKTKWVFDQNKRFNPAFYENSESQIATRSSWRSDRLLGSTSSLLKIRSISLRVAWSRSIRRRRLLVSSPGAIACLDHG